MNPNVILLPECHDQVSYWEIWICSFSDGDRAVEPARRWEGFWECGGGADVLHAACPARHCRRSYTCCVSIFTSAQILAIFLTSFHFHLFHSHFIFILIPTWLLSLSWFRLSVLLCIHSGVSRVRRQVCFAKALLWVSSTFFDKDAGRGEFEVFL